MQKLCCDVEVSVFNLVVVKFPDIPESPKLPPFCEAISSAKVDDVQSPQLPHLAEQDTVQKSACLKQSNSFFNTMMSPTTQQQEHCKSIIFHELLFYISVLYIKEVALLLHRRSAAKIMSITNI